MFCFVCVCFFPSLLSASQCFSPIFPPGCGLSFLFPDGTRCCDTPSVPVLIGAASLDWETTSVRLWERLSGKSHGALSASAWDSAVRGKVWPRRPRGRGWGSGLLSFPVNLGYLALGAAWF